MNNFGKRLQLLRNSKKMSQVKLSTSIDVCQETISAYESGRVKPTIDTAIKIAYYFNVSLDYLFGLDSIPKHIGSDDLNKFETHIIDTYRSLDQRGKEEANKILNCLKEVQRENAYKPK